MRDRRFSLSKKSPGIYFNDGTYTYWVQVSEGFKASPNFIAAIRAARAEFARVYLTVDKVKESGD